MAHLNNARRLIILLQKAAAVDDALASAEKHVELIKAAIEAIPPWPGEEPCILSSPYEEYLAYEKRAAPYEQGRERLNNIIDCCVDELRPIFADILLQCLDAEVLYLRAAERRKRVLAFRQTLLWFRAFHQGFFYPLRKNLRPVADLLERAENLGHPAISPTICSRVILSRIEELSEPLDEIMQSRILEDDLGFLPIFETSQEEDLLWELRKLYHEGISAKTNSEAIQIKDLAAWEATLWLTDKLENALFGAGMTKIAVDDDEKVPSSHEGECDPKTVNLLNASQRMASRFESEIFESRGGGEAEYGFEIYCDPDEPGYLERVLDEYGD